MRIFRSCDAPIGPVDPATFIGRARVRHWHDAAPGGSGTHIAVNVNVATTWMEPVSDEQYAG